MVDVGVKKNLVRAHVVFLKDSGESVVDVVEAAILSTSKALGEGFFFKGILGP